MGQGTADLSVVWLPGLWRDPVALPREKSREVRATPLPYILLLFRSGKNLRNVFFSGWCPGQELCGWASGALQGSPRSTVAGGGRWGPLWDGPLGPGALLLSGQLGPPEPAVRLRSHTLPSQFPPGGDGLRACGGWLQPLSPKARVRSVPRWPQAAAQPHSNGQLSFAGVMEVSENLSSLSG